MYIEKIIEEKKGGFIELIGNLMRKMLIILLAKDQ